MTYGSSMRWTAGGTALAAAGYAAYVGVAWARYGHPPPALREEEDTLLDEYMPSCEIVERHHIAVNAPADLTLAVAKEMDLSASRVIRAVFTAREVLLGAEAEERDTPRGLVEQMLALGWGVLAEVPGREIVVGAVTRPWEANVVFRAVPASDFERFDEPDYVKIAWTLRADPVTPERSVFRTETRAVATDAVARSKFRLYWSCLSPGILLIRRLMMPQVRRTAEQAWRAQDSAVVQRT